MTEPHRVRPRALQPAADLASSGRVWTAAERAALAELFLREYHRLGGAAARAAAENPAAAQALRRRAFAWRATAARIRDVADARWPTWILDHLAASSRLPHVGPEYARQYAYLARVSTPSTGVTPDGVVAPGTGDSVV